MNAQEFNENKGAEASEALGCFDFAAVMEFNERHHLRFEQISEADKFKLMDDAAQGVPQVLRALGYSMMAGQYERFNLSEAIKSVPKRQWLQVCNKLQNTIFRGAFLKSFARNLDPYSDFYLSEELDTKASALEGEFVGVGVATEPEGKYIRVTEVVDDGPAAGKLLIGDLISHIDAHPVEGLNDSELRARIRGSKGSIVKFSGLRSDKSFEVAIARDIVHQKSVTYAWGDEKVLLIKIHRFFRQSALEVERVLKTEGRHAKGFILDLRNNPGGLLTAARDVVDQFVDQGVVVYLKGRSFDDQVWAVKEGGETRKPLVVLVNGATASAAEIVAGALQDYGRGIVVGQKTYGKGSVQNIYETQTALGTKYKGGLKLTTLWYYLPSGKSVRLLQPDIAVKAKETMELAHATMPFLGPDHIQVENLPMPLSKNLSRLKKAGQIAENLDEEQAGKVLLKEMLAGTF